MKTYPPLSKMTRLSTLMGLLIAATLVAGCFGTSVARAVILPPETTIQKVHCGPSEVLVKGYWEHDGSQYIWMNGRCIAPQAGCVWSPGSYKTVTRGVSRVQLWTAGQWRCEGPKAQRPKVVIKPKKKKKPKVVIKPKKKKPVVVPTPPAKSKVIIKPKKKKKPKVVIKPKPTPKPKVVIKPKAKKKPKVVIKPKPTPKPKVVIKPKQKTLVIRNPPAPPSKPKVATKGKVWIRGYYQWNPKTERYQWIKGRFQKKKIGKKWTPGRYKTVNQGPFQVKIWIPGSWR